MSGAAGASRLGSARRERRADVGRTSPRRSHAGGSPNCAGQMLRHTSRTRSRSGGARTDDRRRNTPGGTPTDGTSTVLLNT